MQAIPSDQEIEGSNDLLRLMGHVLSSWQGVEHAIFDLYRTFFDEDHGDVAAISFFAIRTFEARASVTDALIGTFAKDEQKATWAKLHSQIRKRAKLRNSIAHGLFCFVGKSPNRKAMITPSVYDISRFPDAPRDNDFYPARELKDGAFLFVCLTKELYDFKTSLEKDAMLMRELRARPQRLEKNDRRYPLTVHIPPES